MQITSTAPNPVNLHGSTQMHAHATRQEQQTREAVRETAKSETGEPLQDPGSSESRELAKLKQTDRMVRTHEQAHIAAGGQYITSGANFQMRRGPDGRMYAVGGEVGIDTSAVPGDPQATLLKAEAVRRAALAPAQPSAQDRTVAAAASAMAATARSEIAQEQRADGSTSSQRSQTGDDLERRLQNSGAVQAQNDIGNISLFA